jgi:hypothetical protein
MKNHHHQSPVHPASTAPSHDAIAARAYELWESDGHPEDRADALWLEAERILSSTVTAAAPAPKRKRAELALPVSF